MHVKSDEIQGEPEPITTAEVAAEDDKTPRRRRSQRRLVLGKDEAEKGEKDDEEQPEDVPKDGEAKEEGPVTEGSPKIKRGRKAKGRKSAENNTGVSSPRAQSPRSKSLESGSTSPKTSDKSKPFVKLQKLDLGETIRKEEMKRDEERPMRVHRVDGSGKPKKVKDLYEWEDDDDEPIPEYTHTRARKRNTSEMFESPIKGGDKPDESEQDVAQKDEDSDMDTEPIVVNQPDVAQTEVDENEVLSNKSSDILELVTKSPPSSFENAPIESNPGVTVSEPTPTPEPLKDLLPDKPREEEIEHTSPALATETGNEEGSCEGGSSSGSS